MRIDAIVSSIRWMRSGIVVMDTMMRGCNRARVRAPRSAARFSALDENDQSLALLNRLVKREYHVGDAADALVPSVADNDDDAEDVEEGEADEDHHDVRPANAELEVAGGGDSADVDAAAVLICTDDAPQAPSTP